MTHSFSVKTDRIIAVCGSIRAVAIILKSNSLQQHIEKQTNYELVYFRNCELSMTSKLLTDYVNESVSWSALLIPDYHLLKYV